MVEDLNIVNSRATLAELVQDFIDDGEFENDPRWVVRWTLNQFARNDYDTFDRHMRQTALDDPPPIVGHAGWDGFFAALADYLTERDNLIRPDWLDDKTRRNTGPVFYPANNHRNHEHLQQRLAQDPAPWFTERGVGLVLRSLPSGHGKHIPAQLPDRYRRL